MKPTDVQPQAPSTLGQRIAHARRLYGVTNLMDYRPEDLARDLGVSPSSVGRWEKDERAPREDALQQIATQLGVTAAWLRYGIEPMRPAGGTPGEQPYRAQFAVKPHAHPVDEPSAKPTRKRGSGP